MKETLLFDDKTTYLEMCLNMTPSERIKKGFELSEWSARLNKDYKKELNRRLKNYYLLK